METPDTSSIRNIGILAHVDAGKTSITERILHVSGLREKPGDVDEGTTVTDFLGVEKKHGITVKAAAVRFTWGDTLFHLIDTPGHVDFGAEVQRTLRVLDGAVVAVCAVSGVQSRTEVLVKACAERALPRLYFVNKMDRKGADFFRVVEDIGDSLGEKAIAVQAPVYLGGEWKGVIDLVSMEFHEYLPEGSGEGERLSGEALAEAFKKAQSQRAALVEALADYDSDLLDAFIQGKKIDDDLLRFAAGKAFQGGGAAPVFCGSAFADASIELLLKGIIDYLPSPEQAGCPEGQDIKTGNLIRFMPSVDAPFSAFVFKTMEQGYGDTISWTRIWSGTLFPGKKVYDARTGRDVAVKKIHCILADQIEDVKKAEAGFIVGLSVFPAQGGASLCERSHPILYEKLAILRPVVSAAMEPSSAQDISAIRRALNSLALEDTSLVVKEDLDTGRFEVEGQGELHLNIIAERLFREFGVRVKMGKPQVSFRETPKTAVRHLENFDHDFGGARIRLKLGISLRPRESGSGNRIEISSDIHLQSALRRTVVSSIESALEVGPSEGWPVLDAMVVVDEYEPPQASGRDAELAVGAAAAAATRKALLQAGSNTLEPMMQVDIECPEKFFGAALSSVAGRSGRVEAVEEGAVAKLITAIAPMRTLFGFADELRTISQGTISLQAKFARYEKRLLER